MESFLYNPVEVPKGSEFSFTVELEVAISTYDNILCVVYSDNNSENVIAKLSKSAKTGYEIGITSVNTETVLITIPATDTLAAEEEFYNIEVALVGDNPTKFKVKKLFKVTDSKIEL